MLISYLVPESSIDEILISILLEINTEYPIHKEVYQCQADMRIIRLGIVRIKTPSYLLPNMFRT